MTELCTVPKYFLKMINMGYVPSISTMDNAEALIKRVNHFIADLFRKGILPLNYHIHVSSGWRSESYNLRIGGARFSNHVTGHAIDIRGSEIILACEKDPALLEAFGLYAEASTDTKGGGGWTHLQDLPPKSGKRIFRA